MKYWMHLIYFDIQLTRREAYVWLIPLIFYVLILFLFSFALENHDILTTIAPILIWVSALLSLILSMGQLFRQEAEEGILDLYLLSEKPLFFILLCKILSHWLTYHLPLILISPLLGFLLHLSAEKILVLSMTLLLGTPSLSLLGAIGAALTVGIRGSGLLLPILMVPLYIPVLIFSLSAVSDIQHISAYYALLGAIFLFSLALSPGLVSAALRTGVNQ